MKKFEYKRCSKGLWDTTIPDIKFDNNGVSNYYNMFKLLEKEFPKGQVGLEKWNTHLNTIKNEGNGKKYDCVIGLSGGTDSCYLLHLAVKEWGLRPLAVYLDNGWRSDIAVKNIKNMVDKLHVDLETYVINYEEVKSVLTSYMKAGLPWIDGPTDLAIKSSLFKIAAKEGIKTILVGTDFRSEGKQPEEWTHNDSKMFAHIVNKFGNVKLITYPNMSLLKHVYYGLVLRIKRYQPFYFLEYQKQDAQKYLINNYDWIYYGGHHHENLFTKFSIAHWLYNKFGIDKRLITLSAQVISGTIKREDALEQLKIEPYKQQQLELDLPVILKKLDLSIDEFDAIWKSDNKTFHDYPSYHDLFIKHSKTIKKVSHLIMPTKPKMLIIRDE